MTFEPLKPCKLRVLDFVSYYPLLQDTKNDTIFHYYRNHGVLGSIDRISILFFVYLPLLIVSSTASLIQ